jgi:hypothetical protein
MMLNGKGLETPIIDSAKLEPGNYYTVGEALLQGHQTPSVRTNNLISINRQLRFLKENSYKLFQEWTGVRNTFVTYVKIVHLMARIRTSFK